MSWENGHDICYGKRVMLLVMVKGTCNRNYLKWFYIVYIFVGSDTSKNSRSKDKGTEKSDNLKSQTKQLEKWQQQLQKQQKKQEEQQKVNIYFELKVCYRHL